MIESLQRIEGAYFLYLNMLSQKTFGLSFFWYLMKILFIFMDKMNKEYENHNHLSNKINISIDTI